MYNKNVYENKSCFKIPKKKCILILCMVLLLVAIASSIAVRGVEYVSDCPVIKTRLGEIGGIRQRTVLGNNTFCSYRGIRYAKAPIGELRFKEAVPLGPWHGIYNASDYGAACLQPSYSNLVMSEDCLFLNVFVPSTSICSNSSDISIIFYIHGGGYSSGVANDNFYGPHLMLNKCLILVTLNYRLGIFGFLPLALDEYSGNMGLKDQQLALEWVSKYISAFGGNPKQITLMGESAGGASVSLHRLNAKSRSLFKQAYAISSSALSHYALSENNNKTDLIVNVAKHQDINIQNTDQLIEYIQTVDGNYIMNQTTQGTFSTRTIYADPPWQPNIELETATNPFMTKDPQLILASGVNISTIYTHTPMEFTAFAAEVIGNANLIDYLNENFTFTLPFLGIDQISCRAELAPLFTDIRRFYFGESKIDASQMYAYIQLTTFVNFVYSIQKEVIIQALSNSTAKIRLFRVNPRTALGYNRTVPNGFALAGDSHSDDTCSYFWCKSISRVYDEIEQQETLLQKSTVKASEILREIAINFAVTGNPVSETSSFDYFPPVGSQPLSKLPFTELHNTNTLITGNNPNQEEFKFWWDIDQRVEEIKKMQCNQK